jgi:hypothetical protein
MPRLINEIARDVRQDWKKIYFGAEPYLSAMFDLRTNDDFCGYDSAKTIITYFLANASTWRGTKAKEIKQELKEIIK